MIAEKAEKKKRVSKKMFKKKSHSMKKIKLLKHLIEDNLDFLECNLHNFKEYLERNQRALNEILCQWNREKFTNVKQRTNGRKKIQQAWNHAHMSHQKHKSLDFYDKPGLGHTFLPSLFRNNE